MTRMYLIVEMVSTRMYQKRIQSKTRRRQQNLKMIQMKTILGIKLITMNPPFKPDERKS